MDLLSALLLGLVQGLTEFLPISSSGHLVLTQSLLGFEGPNVFFDVMLHLGTLLAVVIFFRRDIADIFFSVFSSRSRARGWNWIMAIVVGSIPTAVIGLVFQEQFKALFGQPRVVAFMLWATALLLILADRARVARTSDGRVGPWQALMVGTAQGLAIIPGISRSGSTICFGLFSGMDPKVAARFSFLLSIPAIIGASVLELRDASIPAGQHVEYAGGVIMAFLSGYVAIGWLLKLLVQRELWKFSVYLFIVGLIGIILT
ncbi:MAG: undecaprenyl-diphosphatase UppP [Candidatus Zixiibacteriota bacterium]|nr:MAG: undecaprenyl-diphosphatase UppP [candidate division Zixibacteria bacterium]